MEPVDLTVLIAAHDHATVLPKALGHLELQDFPAARFEVLVVDAASSDDSAGVVERYSRGAPVATRCIRLASTSLVAAWNAGIAEARAPLVLLLDAELLAGPGLIEQHVQAHARLRERSCVVGCVAAHPQLGPDSFIPLRTLEAQQHLKTGAPLHFLDWRVQNMSLPRSLLLEQGRFDEEFLFPYFVDAELAWRLSRKGVLAHYAEKATAYIWLPSTLDRECGRYYARGYSLHLLARKTHPQEVLRRFPPDAHPLAHRLRHFSAGASAVLCQNLDQETRLFRGLYGHLLRHEFSRGFRDAQRGDAPRLQRPNTSPKDVASTALQV